MKEKKKIRKSWLNIRLNEDEENKLDKLFNRSKSGSLSEYARDVLLQEPVITLNPRFPLFPLVSLLVW